MNNKPKKKFFELRNGLKAVDYRNKDYYDRIDDHERSLYSPYMLMRYVSSVSSKDPFYVEHYVEMVNECVNKHCFTLGKHKKLDCYVWCRDTTIPSMDQTNETCTKQEFKETTKDISNMERGRSGNTRQSYYR